jgi:hypothetical protein
MYYPFKTTFPSLPSVFTASGGFHSSVKESVSLLVFRNKNHIIILVPLL